jgi:hypothetical protein
MSCDPAVADIKAKATSVANSGVEKARRVKDNNTRLVWTLKGVLRGTYANHVLSVSR